MTDILNKVGSVELKDLKDSWEIKLEAGKEYQFEAENTDNHGRFNVVIEAQELNYGEVPITDKWNTLVKCNADPEITVKGSFTAPRSIYGINVDAPEDQEALDKVSYIRVSVKWIVTVHDANYHLRIYE